MISLCFFFTAEEEERVTSYSPVVKAESFACTKSGHVVARLRVRTEREKRYSCEMADLDRARGLSEDYPESETELGQYSPPPPEQSSTVSPHLRLSGSSGNAERIGLCRY